MFRLRVLFKVIDHCSQRRRLARAGGAGDQDHALVIVTKTAHDFRNVQRVERRDLVGDVPKYGADASVLVEQVDAKSATFLGDIREVQVPTIVENILLRVAQDLHDVTFELGVGQFPELDRHQVAVHAKHRRYAHGQVDVGTALGEAEFQE